MAENQTASEDSGQQQKQHQDQQQQQQQQQQQNNQQQDSSPDQESSSDSITPNPRSKPVVMKNSLRSMKVPRTISGTSADAANHQSQGSSGKHHHHTNHHHLHNNASSGHHGHNVIHRTTSESLRLGSEFTGGSGSMTNSTSNSSMHGGGSSSLASTTTTNNSNSTTSNHSHSMSSSSSPHSHSHSSHPHSHQHISNSGGGGGPLPRKPKTSSFQITSVTVGNKLSSDNGDDSADDLDESHTDDNSRITDLETETPSVSEDTFSKEDVFFANNALSTTAPVIPTSAQYGLVVVDPIGPSVGQTIQNVQVNVADNIINVVSAVGNKKKPEVKETQHRSERFKVVKIESTEPFRRGRWMCMDYLDHSGNKDINAEKNLSGSGVQSVSSVSTASVVTGDDASRGATQTAIILTNDTSAGIANSVGGGGGGGVGGVENHIDAAAKLAADSINVYRSESQNSAGTGQNATQTIVHAQTLGGPLNLQQQQQQSQLPNQFQGQHFEGGHGQTLPIISEFQQQQQQQQPPPQHQQQVNGNEPSVAGQSQPASFFVNQLNATGGSVAAGNGTATNFQQQQQQSTPAHGVTLPANIHMQNGGSGGNGATTFQPVSYIPTSEMGVSAGASIQQTNQQPQQQQSSRVYVSQASTSAAPQSYPNAAAIMTGGGGGAAAGSSAATAATYTSAPTTHQLADSINPIQGTQQSDSNAATPSNGGQSQPQAQPQQQFQSMHPNPLAGQTMPILSQMSYDIQAQQSQPTQPAQTNTPATVSDPTALAATIQQQQQQPIDNKVASSSSTGADSSPNVSSSAGGGGGGGGGSSSGGGSTTATSSSISQQAPSSSSSLSVAGSVQVSTTGGSAAGTSTTGSSDDHQLHHNPETETERGASSLSHALAHRRKTISAIPQLPTLAPIFDFNEPADPLADMASEAAAGTQNLFTNLALGDDRFKLPVRYSSDEGMDSLAGSCPVTRSMPIPISGAGAFGRQMSYDVMSQSASPTSRANPYSPFYYGSPMSAEAMPQSISYDPSYAYPSNRLIVPISMARGGHRNIDDRGWARAAGGGGDGVGVGIDGGRGGNNRSSSSPTAAVLADGAVAAVSALNSASGTSAVAIDNKIEQAMDLVKSHLMIAVREEVEVLKEKISELMDKINQLEVENTILKANMPQETLHQLQLQTQLQITGSGASNIIAQQPPPQQQQQQQAQPQQAQQQSATQQSQQPSQQQQQNQQQQQQPAPQAANPANTTTNGPMS